MDKCIFRTYQAFQDFFKIIFIFFEKNNNKSDRFAIFYSFSKYNKDVLCNPKQTSIAMHKMQA